MKKVNILHRFFIIAILLLSFGLFAQGVFFATNSYADTEPTNPNNATYTVSFRVGSVTYKAYRLNAGQYITKPDEEDIARYEWINTSGGSNIFDFANTTMPNQNLILTLRIPDVTKYAVIFYKKNPNYDASRPSNDYYSEYTGLDIKIVDQGATVAEYDPADVDAEVGLQCTGWLTNTSATTYFNFDTAITSHTALYPKFERVKYDLTFIHYDGTEETHEVEHGVYFTEGVVGKPQANKEFAYWYREDDASKTAIPFDRTTFDRDERFLAAYYDNVYSVTFRDTAENFGTFTGDTRAFLNQTYTCTITLSSDYDQYELKSSNVRRIGSASTHSVAKTATKGVYTLSVVNVSGNIELELTGLTKNKYNAAFDYTYAKGISVVPNEAATEYTYANSKYSVEYGKTFYFTLALDGGYEAEVSNINSSSCVANGFFEGADVAWFDRFSCYYLTVDNADSNVVVRVNTVECVTVTFSGIEHLNINMGAPSFSSSLVKWDTSNDSIYTARIKRSQRHTFTVTTTDDEKYFIAGFEGNGLTKTANNNEYAFYSANGADVVFNVIETVYVYAPASLTGVSNFAYNPSVNAGGGNYNNITGNYEYKTEKGGDFAVTFTFTTEYTEAVPNISLVGGGNATVDMSAFSDTKTITIRGIDSACTITYSPLEKNRYTITLMNNEMANISVAGDGNNIVHYGENISLAVYKTTAYSDAEIGRNNISITSSRYASFDLAKPEGEDYYLLTIKTIVGSFTVSIEDLIKNTYYVSLIGNEYAELTTSNEYAQYDGRYVCSYTLGSAFSKSSPRPENIKVTDTLTGAILSTLPITIDTVQRTITIDHIISEITIYIDELARNTYTVAANYFANTVGYTSDKQVSENVTHGSSFTFNLLFDDPSYSQSIERIVVQYSVDNGDFIEIEPVRNDDTLIFSIYNISGNINFRVNDLTINKYTVVFYDTDPVREIYRYNAVSHGSKITEPTRPTKEGYQCIGWYYSEFGTSQFNGFNSGISQDLTLYARYNSQTFTVTFVDYSAVSGKIDRETVQTVNYGRPVIVPTPAPMVGHTSSYWDTTDMNLNSVKQNYRVVAVYEIDVYTVTFVNDTIIHDVQHVEYGSKATTPTTTPRKQGHTFKTWDYDYLNNPITEDTTINATYEVVSYNIRFINVTQGNSLMASYKLNYDSKITEPQEFVDANGEVVRGKYYFPYMTSSGMMNTNLTSQLNSGYVLEGWYADEGLSMRYNFDNPIKGETTIYGNMYISKVSVKFYVDGNFYMEKLVDYNNSLTDIPNVPRKEGYTQRTAIWTTRNLENIDTSSYNESNIAELNAEFNNKITNLQNNINVYSLYRINTYRVTFKLPDGTNFVREVYHGGTVTNVPYPDTNFGEVVVIDKNLLQYVTADTIIYITIIDFLPFLIVAGSAAVLAFVVISLVIAIRNMRKGIRNIKNMESLFKAIKEQDERLTKMKEEKLRKQLEEQMKQKQNRKRNNLLDD